MSTSLTVENPQSAPQPVGPYSQVAKVDMGNSYMLLISGQIGVKTDKTLAGDTMATQAAQAFDNLEAILASYGATLSSIAHIRTYLVDMTQIREYGKVRLDRFGAHIPASTTLEVKSLFMPGALLEIEASAVIDK